MVTLRLFHRSDPTREIERRELDDGEIAVGRGDEADWTIADPSRALSRLHCILAARDGLVTVKDSSANGVFLARGGQRAPAGVEAPVGPGETLGIGEYLIRVDACVAEDGAAVPAEPKPDQPVGALLEAFCTGAGIDASVLAGQDEAELMARIGLIYRQMVAGLAALTEDRVRSKAAHRLHRTTVQALDNNPFRWAPPQRVAGDLLKDGAAGFKSGPGAVEAVFEETRAHLAGLEAGWAAAMAAMLQALSPDAAEAKLEGRSFLMKNRAAALWAEHVQAQAAAGEPDAFAEPFRRAYEAQQPD